MHQHPPFPHSGMVNLTLAVVPPAVLVLVVLMTLEATLDASDSREPLFFWRLVTLRAAPLGLCATLIDDLLLDGDLLTLCAGANRPCLGEHSKYLD